MCSDTCRSLADERLPRGRLTKPMKTRALATSEARGDHGGGTEHELAGTHGHDEVGVEPTPGLDDELAWNRCRRGRRPWPGRGRAGCAYARERA
jgi:hypothetical protein